MMCVHDTVKNKWIFFLTDITYILSDAYGLVTSNFKGPFGFIRSSHFLQVTSS